MVRHRRLEQVAGAVQLVLDGEVGPALVRVLEGEVGVQVAVGLLRRGHDGDHLVDVPLDLGVGRRRQLPGAASSHL